MFPKTILIRMFVIIQTRSQSKVIFKNILINIHQKKIFKNHFYPAIVKVTNFLTFSFERVFLLDPDLLDGDFKKFYLSNCCLFNKEAILFIIFLIIMYSDARNSACYLTSKYN